MAQDVSMTRPQREMTDEGRARLQALLSKPTLTPVEKGELAALGRQGSQLDRDAANDKLGGTSSSSPARRDPEFARKLGEAVGRNVARYLDERN
jgi:hypothetical protein